MGTGLTWGERGRRIGRGGKEKGGDKEAYNDKSIAKQVNKIYIPDFDVAKLSDIQTILSFLT